ncbi:MAG TPA: orotidine-5'-phosphate decarboxylase [Chitinophagaceae bacterium]|nr:orotidine-5'-phosphate decarboxylase [Chitinophagaceae bacterium]
MNRNELVQQIRTKKSYLCIGLDTDLSKIPAYLLEHDDPMFEFNKLIIDATHDLCVSYKLNTAFYEAHGVKGWQSLEKTLHYIPENIFTIADAKRGDIGNTSTQYAKAFFETLPFNSITVAPYMGKDSVKPFLEFENKWTIVLGLTSNEGAFDFQTLNVGSEKLFETVLHKVSEWGNENNLMFVVGATKAEQLSQIRKIIPHHFLLIPGVGTQGGSLEEVSKHGMNDDIGILVNVSRQVIYAGKDGNFAEMARQEALKLQNEMANYL